MLAEAALYIGNDSGLTHLAAATGCPTIALFGASDPAVWRPLGDHVRVIVSEVSCGPCHLKRRENIDCDRRCMSAISVERVHSLALDLLNGGTQR